jgi:serine/threonine-protein kinase HipA
MSATSRQLHVQIEGRSVGVLSEAGAVWQFAYNDDWLAAVDGYDLAPGLPRSAKVIVDGGSERPVQWFFDNLLPEEESRVLLAREAKLELSDAFALLVAYGAESAGALTLLEPGASSTDEGLQPLQDDVLSRRIRALPRAALSADAPKRMSLAGAQYKLAAVEIDGALHEPRGRTPSMVILKPDHPRIDDYPHSAANEWFCMTLAKRMGLDVPEVRLRHVPEAVYVINRFDRQGAWPAVRRRHVVDACQLLSKDRSYKYALSTPETLRALVERCDERASTRLALFQWVIFNSLIGNGDAHLKNLSFFVFPEGFRLAPFYDLISTASYAPGGQWGRAELTMPIGEARHFGELRRSDFLRFAWSIDVGSRLFDREVDAFCEKLPIAAKQFIEELESGGFESMCTAGELRQLRMICHGPIREFTARLQRRD